MSPLSYRSLCETCRHQREVISGKGSRFLLCQLSASEAAFPKYPPQPVTVCSGYQARDPAANRDS